MLPGTAAPLPSGALFDRVRTLRPAPYLETFAAMRAFTEARDASTPDELWLCEHEPVFTLGLAGRAEHVLDAGPIPVVQTNRGGQVTYHGPGQVVAYPLVDLKRAGLHVKEYVHRIESAVLNVLESYSVTGHRVVGAPGVYVRLDDPYGHAVLKRSIAGAANRAEQAQTFEGLAKIAAIGIKVARHCTYHGVAFNVAMDLDPFGRIDPCGYPGLRAVDLARLDVFTHWDEAAGRLAARLASQLGP